jgi:isoquinoline 1-oxidoreductase beta subunit
MELQMDRRTLIKATVSGVAGLTLGVTVGGGCGRLLKSRLEPFMWLNISPDNEITIIVVKNEMGQGVSTTLPMIVAEELEADWERIRVEFRPELQDHVMSLDGNYGTADSMCMRLGFEPMRRVGAAAKWMLIAACSEMWGVRTDSLTARDSRIWHPTRGSITYGQLAAAAATFPVPRAPKLKDPTEFKIIGQPLQRLDMPLHIEGRSTFGIDVVVPNMVYAAVLQSPVFGGEVSNLGYLSVDGTNAEAIVSIPNGVAVVAGSWWDAKRTLDSLDVQFTNPSGMEELSSEIISTRLAAGMDAPGLSGRSEGNAKSAMQDAAIKIDGVFEVPYLDHAALEPMNCTAHVTADSCEIWAPTQWAGRVLGVAQEITHLPASAIKIHPTYLGGGFGRKWMADFCIHAILASQAVGKPVKVIWSREEDMRHGYYRGVARAVLSGGLDADGNIVSWISKLAAPTMGVGNRLEFSLAGFRDLPYSIPNIDVRFVDFKTPVPNGYLRSVNMSHNFFFVESFVDDLAHAASTDPLEFRLKHLRGNERAAVVLERAAALANWGTPNMAGAAHGVALFDYTAFDNSRTVVAHVAELSIDASRQVKVHRLYCVVDCGLAINPDIVRAQIEGGTIFGLTAALYGEITVEGGAVEQSNFHDYRLVDLGNAPVVEVEIINTQDFPSGIGEYGVPGTMPAVTNAIFTLTGERITRLPISKHGWT